MAADAANGVHWLNENTLLYPVGHAVALCNHESKAQRFIPATPESTGISALAITPNRKYLAVGEQGDKASVTIYDLASLKRRKVLISSVAGSKVRLPKCAAAAATENKCAGCGCQMMMPAAQRVHVHACGACHASPGTHQALQGSSRLAAACRRW